MLYQQIKRIVDSYIDEYSFFMGIEYRPSYELQLKEVSHARADIDGIESLANTRFLIELKKHILCVATNLPIEKYILFHELTHMLDSDLYVNGSKIRKTQGHTGYSARCQRQLAVSGGYASPYRRSVRLP